MVIVFTWHGVVARFNNALVMRFAIAIKDRSV